MKKKSLMMIAALSAFFMLIPQCAACFIPPGLFKPHCLDGLVNG